MSYSLTLKLERLNKKQKKNKLTVSSVAYEGKHWQFCYYELWSEALRAISVQCIQKWKTRIRTETKHVKQLNMQREKSVWILNKNQSTWQSVYHSLKPGINFPRFTCTRLVIIFRGLLCCILDNEHMFHKAKYVSFTTVPE